jgi:putrescine transport system substrate-binding protein
VFLKLDKSQLPHFRNMDPDSLAIVAEFDPGNEHASVWQWGTTGIGYNVQRVRAGLGSAAVGSWSLILDPANASKLQKCGITLLDAPEDVIDAVYIYLGKDLNAENPDDLNAAVAVLMSVRPYIKYFNSSSYIEDLANGGVCVSFGWSGNVFLAKRRAREAREDFDIEYLILSEGAEVWLDTIAIPADAPHPGDAHKFLDYTMRPEVIAAVTNYLSYANGNRASLPLVDAELRSDPNIYPPPEVRSGLVVGKPRSPEYSRLLSRAWTTIKTGR